MTDPGPGLPQAPPTRVGELRPERRGSAADLVVSLLLWGALALGSLIVAFFSLFFGMMSDGCYEGVDDGICSDTGAGIFMAALLGFWALLAVTLVVSLVMIILGYSRGRRSWPWPLGALVLDVVAIVVLLAVLASLSPS